MLVILSKDTRYTGSVLSYEIQQAIDVYKIPLIVAYPGYSSIGNVDALEDMWPKTLAERINDPDTKAIHIAFQKSPIMDAINQFTVNNKVKETQGSFGWSCVSLYNYSSSKL